MLVDGPDLGGMFSEYLSNVKEMRAMSYQQAAMTATARHLEKSQLRQNRRLDRRVEKQLTIRAAKGLQT